MSEYWTHAYLIAICSIPFWLLFVLYAREQQREKEDRVKKLEERIGELEEKQSEDKTTEKD